MAIASEKLKRFFSSQKIGSTEALKQHGKINDKNLKQALPDAISQPVSDSLAKPNQHVSKSVSKKNFIKEEYPTSAENFSLNIFSRKEKELIDFIFMHCHAEGSRESPAIQTNDIIKHLNISPERLRNLIFRINGKTGVNCKMIKSGKNACRVFEFKKNLYQALIEEKNKHKINILNVVSNPLATNYVSSNINNKTITNFPEIWQKINFEPLAEIGFSETQLRQLYEKNLDPEIIQQSIYHFAWGLENNPIILEKYKDPLNTLMGVLRKGGVWIETNYESPEVLALRQLLETKKREKEQREKLVREMAELEFPEWRESLTLEEIKNHLPEKIANYKNPPEETVELYLKEAFIKKVFPERFKRGEFDS